MSRILYGVSPIGLGHATRSLVLLEELKRRGVEVRVFSGGKAAEFFRQIGVAVDDIVDDPVPSVFRGEMRRVALWYIRSWIANRRTIRRTERLLESYLPDLIVCDEEFSGIVLAGRKNIKRVFISDELELGFARTWLARKIEGRVERWYKKLQDSVDVLIVPDLGTNTGNRRFVGPIVRCPTLSSEDTKRKYHLPDGPMILFSMSGSGIGRDLVARVKKSVDEANIGNPILVVTGNRGPPLPGEGVFDLGLVEDNQNLVASADLVLSTAGKSTIDEAAFSGSPIIVIPIRHHAEQERNARALGYSSDDASRLPVLIREKVGRRLPPRDFKGEVAAADAVMALLKLSRMKGPKSSLHPKLS